MDAGTSPPTEEAGPGYEGVAIAGAVLATVFFPFISLVAALALHVGQSDPRKKAQLRTWAWVSGSWLAFGVVIALIALGVVAGHASGSNSVSRSGPCQGGPEQNSTGRNIPGTDKYVFPCVFGGTETTRLPTP